MYSVVRLECTPPPQCTHTVNASSTLYGYIVPSPTDTCLMKLFRAVLLSHVFLHANFCLKRQSFLTVKIKIWHGCRNLRNRLVDLLTETIAYENILSAISLWTRRLHKSLQHVATIVAEYLSGCDSGLQADCSSYVTCPNKRIPLNEITRIVGNLF